MYISIGWLLFFVFIGWSVFMTLGFLSGFLTGKIYTQMYSDKPNDDRDLLQ